MISVMESLNDKPISNNKIFKNDSLTKVSRIWLDAEFGDSPLFWNKFWLFRKQIEPLLLPLVIHYFPLIFDFHSIQKLFVLILPCWECFWNWAWADWMLQREWDWENYEEVESDSWTFNCLLQVLSLKLPSHMSVTIHESHE